MHLRREIRDNNRRACSDRFIEKSAPTKGKRTSGTFGTGQAETFGNIAVAAGREKSFVTSRILTRRPRYCPPSFLLCVVINPEYAA